MSPGDSIRRVESRYPSKSFLADIGLDTNVLVRFIMCDDEEHFEHAHKLIRRAAQIGLSKTPTSIPQPLPRESATLWAIALNVPILTLSRQRGPKTNAVLLDDGEPTRQLVNESVLGEKPFEYHDDIRRNRTVG